ncbi:MAG: hypothetical protein ACHREM_11890, partial [Polyangiales bacterium]
EATKVHAEQLALVVTERTSAVAALTSEHSAMQLSIESKEQAKYDAIWSASRMKRELRIRLLGVTFNLSGFETIDGLRLNWDVYMPIPAADYGRVEVTSGVVRLFRRTESDIQTASADTENRRRCFQRNIPAFTVKFDVFQEPSREASAPAKCIILLEDGDLEKWKADVGTAYAIEAEVELHGVVETPKGKSTFDMSLPTCLVSAPTLSPRARLSQ